MGGLGPGIGGFELVVVGLVALLVVGPKDLPVLMRRVGQMVAKARAMANEFRSSFDEMARQSELDDLRKEVEALRNTRLTDTLGPIPTFEELGEGHRPSDPVPYDPESVSIEAEGAEYGETPSILPPQTATITEAGTEVQPGEPSPETRT